MSDMTTAAKVRRRTRRGVVSRDKMDKTIVVEVKRRVMHPRYHKFVKERTRYMAHDEANSACIGDMVVIEERRPISKTKRWELKEIIDKASSL